MPAGQLPATPEDTDLPATSSTPDDRDTSTPEPRTVGSATASSGVEISVAGVPDPDDTVDPEDTGDTGDTGDADTVVDTGADDAAEAAEPGPDPAAESGGASPEGPATGSPTVTPTAAGTPGVRAVRRNSFVTGTSGTGTSDTGSTSKD